MNVYHVTVKQEDGWFVGRVLERAGVTTQGRTLDELVAMLRDAIESLWGKKNVQLGLLISSSITIGAGRNRAGART